MEENTKMTDGQLLYEAIFLHFLRNKSRYFEFCWTIEELERLLTRDEDEEDRKAIENGGYPT